MRGVISSQLPSWFPPPGQDVTPWGLGGPRIRGEVELVEVRGLRPATATATSHTPHLTASPIAHLADCGEGESFMVPKNIHS